MRVISAALAVVLLTAAIGGCSPYDSRFSYVPKPAIVGMTRAEDRETTVARALVSVLGLRREDKSTKRPAGVELRLRLENAAAGRLTFDPASLKLLSGDLQEFPQPETEPAAPVTIAAGAAATCTAFFALPGPIGDGGLDMGGLNVQLTIDYDGQLISASVTLALEPRYYYTTIRAGMCYPDPFWYGYYGRVQ